MKDILMTAFFIVIIIRTILKNRKVIKELTKLQIYGVGISYLVATLMASICIYYGGNWVAGHFSNIIFSYVIFLAVFCIALYLCISILNKVLQKITNGVLPKN